MTGKIEIANLSERCVLGRDVEGRQWSGFAAASTNTNMTGIEKSTCGDCCLHRQIAADRDKSAIDQCSADRDSAAAVPAGPGLDINPDSAAVAQIALN